MLPSREPGAEGRACSSFQNVEVGQESDFSILGKTLITGTVTFTGNLDLPSKEYPSNDTAGTLLLLQVFSAYNILLLFTKPAKTLG